MNLEKPLVLAFNRTANARKPGPEKVEITTDLFITDSIAAMES